MSSPPLSAVEPSINSNSNQMHHIPYTEVTHEEEADVDSKNLKFSLAHYFSMIFAIFIALLVIATIVLFIWSNSSDGAWVSLQVTPILPDPDNHDTLQQNHEMMDAWFPFLFSFISFNSNFRVSSKSTILQSNLMHNTEYNHLNTLSSLLVDTDNLNRFKYSTEQLILHHLAATNSTTTDPHDITPDIASLKLNKNIFHFSLVSSVSDFWQSKAYSLAILIALFSGIWPYIKLLLLGVCWIVPLRQERREAILIFLDQMGKFSFIDLFVSLYMIVSFYVSITESVQGYGINLKVVVEPDVGLNTFVIGTVISMIFSHFFLYLDAKYAKPHIKQLRHKRTKNIQQHIQYHDDPQQADEVDELAQVDEDELEMKQLQNKHAWNTSFQPLFMRYVPRSVSGVLFRSLMLFSILVTLWCVIESVFTAPVRYTMQGLVGAFVDDPIRAFSPWQITKEVPTHTDEHQAAPPLAVCFFAEIIFFPLLLIVIVVVIWYVPMRYQYCKYLNIGMQVCMAWAALDVYAVASVAASLELQRVSQWILNQNYAEICGEPDGIIPSITDKFIGKPVSCFDVKGNLVWGIWLVIYAAIALWIAFVYTIHQLFKSKQYMTRSLHKGLADKTIFMFNH